MHTPTEIKLLPDKATLQVAFGAQVFSLPAVLLRVESPSAEVQGHGPTEKKLVLGVDDIIITHITPVGNYAVRLTFSDGHSTGLYTWDYLHELGTTSTEKLTAYQTAVAAVLQKNSAVGSGCGAPNCCGGTCA